jgi:hypothetical protein
MTNKETLEELGRFAERKYLERLNNYENCDFSDGVIEGAKWQAEKSYTKEEVIAFAKWMYDYKADINRVEEWLEQFKK